MNNNLSSNPNPNPNPNPNLNPNPNPNSNLNSSEELYLTLVHSYINATREILNGYMTFENGLTRSINSQIFRNFTRSSLPTTTAIPTTVTHGTSVSVSTETTRNQERERLDASNATEYESDIEPVIQTPVNLIRRETQMPDTPIRPTLRFRSNPPSSSSAPSSPFQIPTPVRLTARLDTPPEEPPRFTLPRRIGSTSQLRQPQQSNSNPSHERQHSLQTTQNQNVHSTTTPTPPFASSFVRYRLPVPIGPPRRVPAADTTATTTAATSVRNSIDVPVFSPPESPSLSPSPPPPPPSIRGANQIWQQLRRQQEQEQLVSLSPILPIEPTPLPPAPLATGTRMVLNLLDTPRFNDSLIYYTQIINRELANSNQGRGRTLSYDVIQQQTKIIPYCTIVNPLNDICPISQVQFDLIDSVMQINICKHNFNPYSLIRWFDTNSTCPMCRQQININIENDDDNDDEQTIHMYNNGLPYSSESAEHRENNYNHDDSDFYSVG